MTATPARDSWSPFSVRARLSRTILPPPRIVCQLLPTQHGSGRFDARDCVCAAKEARILFYLCVSLQHQLPHREKLKLRDARSQAIAPTQYGGCGGCGCGYGCHRAADFRLLLKGHRRHRHR